MKKNIILLCILGMIGGVYFGLNYRIENSREKKNSSNIHINFQDFSYDYIKSDTLEIKNKKVIYTGTGIYETDIDKIDSFIDEIKNIQVLSIASTNVENFESFGIYNTGATIFLGNTKILLGNNTGLNGKQYIAVQGLDIVFFIDKDLKNMTNKTSNFFRKEENIGIGTGVTVGEGEISP